MGLLNLEDFEDLWRTLGQTDNDIWKAIKRLERRVGRAEIGGAAELVTELPDPEIPGRLLYLDDTLLGGLYLDRETAWEGPLGAGGRLLATDSYFLAANIDTAHSTWTPVDTTHLTLPVVPVTETLELHWCIGARRLTGAATPGYIDLGYDDGLGGHIRYGNDTYGMTRLEVDDSRWFHLTAFFEVTPGISYTFYLMDAGADATYKNRFRTNQLTTWWAIAR